MSSPSPNHHQYHLPLRIAATIFTKHPFKAIIFSLLPSIFCLAVILATDTLHLSSPQLDDYFIRNNQRTLDFDARKAAITFYGLPISNLFRINFTRTRPNKDFSLLLLFRTPSKHMSILTPSTLAAMKRAEDVVFSNTDFPRFCFHNPESPTCGPDAQHLACALPESPLLSPHLYGVQAEASDTVVCNRRNDSRVPSEDAVRLFVDDIGKNNTSYGRLLGNGAQSGATWIASSRIAVGTPFTGYSENADVEPEEFDKQGEEYSRWIRVVAPRITEAAKPELDTFVMSAYLGRMRFTDAVYADLVYCLIALAVVALLLIIHTRSILLAAIAILQVASAFPLALVLYTFVFRVPYLSALHVFAVYLLLGIAADDVFVFTDAWKQAPVLLGECDLYDRMAWTYRRAVKAMLITSVTTAASFCIMAVSPIMPIATFGIWAALLILTQFGLVCTTFPCALVIWERYLRGFPSFLGCFKSDGASPSNRKSFGVDRVDDSLAESAKAGGSKADTKYTDTTDVRNTIGGKADIEEGDECSTSPRMPDSDARKSGSASRGLGAYVQRLRRWCSKDTSTEYRWLEQLFNGTWTNVLFCARYWLIVIAVLWMGTAIGLTTQVRSLDQPEAVLSRKSSGSVAESQIQKEFGLSHENELIEVKLTWGIGGVDRTGTSYYRRDLVGKPVLDTTFDLKPKASQDFLLNLCRRIGNDSDLVDVTKPREKRVQCWIEDFQRWRREGEGPPEFYDYPNDASLLVDVLSFGREKPYLKYIVNKDVIMSDVRKIVASEVRFLTPVKWRSSATVIQDLFDKWEVVLAEANANAPPSLNKAFVTAGDTWLFQVAQVRLVRSTIIGCVSMLAVTCVILTLTTQSFVCALLATGALMGVACSMWSFVYIMGWKLGISESLTSVISIGYAFDGIAHIVIAYNEASMTRNRVERTRDALTALGISIVFGTLSTALSSVTLLLATVLVLRKLGILIVLTMVMTVLWSLVFLPAALMVVGPERKNPLLQKATSCLWSFLRFKWVWKTRKERGSNHMHSSTSVTKDAPTEDVPAEDVPTKGVAVCGESVADGDVALDVAEDVSSPPRTEAG